MKRVSMAVPAMCACGALFLIANVLSTGEAGDKAAKKAAKAQKVAAKAEKTHMHFHRVTSLMKMDVQSEKGEDLGSVKDLMINIQNGRVIYVAVNTDDKFFAIPLAAFKVKSVQDRSDEKVLVLNMTKSELDAIPGFDENVWPTSADPRFGKDIHIEAAGVKVKVSNGDRATKGEPAVTVEEDDDDVTTTKDKADKKDVEKKEGDKSDPNQSDTGKSDVDKQSPAKSDQDVVKAHFRRFTSLTGVSVKNTKGESLGTVRDCLVHVRKQHIVYVAVGHGGLLTIGEKLHAVPWDAVEIRSLTGNRADESFIIDIDKATFEKAKGFDKDSDWPTEGNRSLFPKVKRPQAV